MNPLFLLPIALFAMGSGTRGAGPLRRAFYKMSEIDRRAAEDWLQMMRAIAILKEQAMKKALPEAEARAAVESALQKWSDKYPDAQLAFWAGTWAGLEAALGPQQAIAAIRALK